jgi:hypothetical protein
MDILVARADRWSTASPGNSRSQAGNWKVTFRPRDSREGGNAPHQTGTLRRSHQHDAIAELGEEIVV